MLMMCQIDKNYGMNRIYVASHFLMDRPTWKSTLNSCLLLLITWCLTTHQKMCKQNINLKFFCIQVVQFFIIIL